MSEITDLLIQASGSNLAIAVMILGLAFVDLMQTRYLTARMERMCTEIKKVEERQWNHLHGREGPRRRGRDTSNDD